jgi:hypothetical protein
MTQSDAIQVIQRLIPKMEGSSPEQVLSKYATDRRLAPAQLERLGHVFNTASTLSAMERDRESAPVLLDVPTMVRSYKEATGRPARASALFDEPQQKAASAAIPSLHSRELPAVWEEPQQKVAAAPAELPAKKISSQVYLMKALPKARELLKVAADRRFDFFDRVKALQKEAKAAGFKVDDLNTLYSDLKRRLGPDSARAVTGKFATFLANEVELIDLPELHIDRDRTGFRDKLASAWSLLEESHEAHQAFCDVCGDLDKHASVCTDFQTRERVRHFLQEASRLGKYGLALDFEKEAAPVAAGPWAGSNDYARRAEENWKELEEAETEQQPLSDRIPAFLAGTFYAAGAAKDEAQKLFGHDIPQIVDEFSPQGRFGQYLDQQLGRKNRAKLRDQQLDYDRIATDTQSMANLQALVMKDDILATKPFDKVFEAFQAIRRASPEVASDRSLLRIMLRQAVETQGLDIDTATAGRKFEFPARGPSRATWGTSQVQEGDIPKARDDD